MKQYCNKLLTSESDLQFSYNVNTGNSTYVYCTYLDATQAFNHVFLCIKRGLPIYIVFPYINYYAKYGRHTVRVCWHGMMSKYLKVVWG